jgi:peptide/nickel transport system ATP-binding protein
MLQRVVIAMAIASQPSARVGQPTTGLDATVEAEVLDLISGLATRSAPRSSSSATASA